MAVLGHDEPVAAQRDAAGAGDNRAGREFLEMRSGKGLLPPARRQEVKGYSPVTSGLLFLPFVGGILVTSTVSTVALPRIGPRALIASGLLLSTGAMAYLTQLTVTSSYAAGILPAAIVLGMGSA
jgi:hypothetical protein